MIPVGVAIYLSTSHKQAMCFFTFQTPLFQTPLLASDLVDSPMDAQRHLCHTCNQLKLFKLPAKHDPILASFILSQLVVAVTIGKQSVSFVDKYPLVVLFLALANSVTGSNSRP